MHVLICGGGVVGCTIAYFLSRRGVKATVIEGTGLACAASGKSGGFLARDWCDGSPLSALARRSFDLHAQLAEEVPDEWGYRRLDTYGGFASQRSSARQFRNAYDLDWFAADVTISQALGSPATTAQVHPGQFTLAMMRAAEAKGVELRQGRVTGISLRAVAGVHRGRGRWRGDRWRCGGDRDGAVVDPRIAMELKLPPVFGLKGHSLVFDTGTAIPAEAAFLEYQESGGAVLTPELFPRTDGTTYVCGISGEEALPIDPARVQSRTRRAIYRLEAMCRACRRCWPQHRSWRARLATAR